jgi:hypothetical protein
MVFVIETKYGIVSQVIPFMNSPGVDALELANNLAKLMCEQNGIVFEGNSFKGSISCDSSPTIYSIQVVEQC